MLAEKLEVVLKRLVQLPYLFLMHRGDLLRGQLKLADIQVAVYEVAVPRKHEQHQYISERRIRSRLFVLFIILASIVYAKYVANYEYFF